MKVKFNGSESDTLSLIGGGPQGSLIGQIMYKAMIMLIVLDQMNALSL